MKYGKYILLLVATMLFSALISAQSAVRIGGETIIKARLIGPTHVFVLKGYPDPRELDRREIEERYQRATARAGVDFDSAEARIVDLKNSYKESDKEDYADLHEAHQAKYEEAMRLASLDRDNAYIDLYGEPQDELLSEYADIVIHDDQPYQLFCEEVRGTVVEIVFYEPWHFYRGPCYYDWHYGERIHRDRFFERVRSYRNNYERRADHTIFGWRSRDSKRPPIRDVFRVRSNERARLPDKKIDRKTGRGDWVNGGNRRSGSQGSVRGGSDSHKNDSNHSSDRWKSQDGKDGKSKVNDHDKSGDSKVRGGDKDRTGRDKKDGPKSKDDGKKVSGKDNGDGRGAWTKDRGKGGNGRAKGGDKKKDDKKDKNKEKGKKDK